MKKLIEKAKLYILKYLIVQLQTKDINAKFKIFKKLDSMKISLNMGLELLDASLYDYNVEDKNGGINSSLVALCIKDYKKEYNEKIKKYFPKYSRECQDRVVYLLSSIDNEYSLNLYVDLILKYYKDRDIIPISNLYERADSYKILFPKLFKAIKFNSYKNNIFILINDYLNAGVIPDSDLKKYKRTLTLGISKIINESLKYKFSSTTSALKNEKYRNLRMFLETSINMEQYVSTKTTEKLIDKLYKRKDNQLKLFILENYIKKAKNINKLDLKDIAKDKLSRYPLYELLTIYNMLDLFPKTYIKHEKLAESDLYINFIILNGYTELPKKIKYIKNIEIDKHLYYVYSFSYSFYNNSSLDATTDYLIKEAGLDKYKKKKVEANFIGMSGGYNKENPALIETINKKILWNIKKNSESIDDVIEKIKKELNISKPKIVPEPEEITFEEQSKSKFKFSYLIIFLLILLIASVVAFFLFLEKPELMPFDLESKNNSITTTAQVSKLKYKDVFKEISGHDIYKQEQKEYYVLFYKKKSDENSYYTYLNKLLSNDQIIYYVDLTKKENKFLYKPNDLGLILSSERYLKVEDGDFRFYVDGKSNILNEMKKEAKVFDKTKKETKKVKKEKK